MPVWIYVHCVHAGAPGGQKEESGTFRYPGTGVPGNCELHMIFYKNRKHLYCWAISSAHEFSLNKFILVIYFYHSKSVLDPFPLGNNPKHSRETRRWKCKCQFQQNQKRANIWILQNRQEELSEAGIQHRVARPRLRSQKMGLSARQDGKREVRGLRYQQMLTCCKCGLPSRSKVTSLFTVVGPEVSLTRFDSKPMWNTKWSCTQVSHLFRKLWSQRPLSGVFYTYPKGTI